MYLIKFQSTSKEFVNLLSMINLHFTFGSSVTPSLKETDVKAFSNSAERDRY